MSNQKEIISKQSLSPLGSNCDTNCQYELEQYIPPQLPQEPSGDTTVLSQMLGGSVNTFMSYFSSGWATEDGPKVALTPSEIDNLAVFQGDLETFVRSLPDTDINKVEKISLGDRLLQDDNGVEWERRCRQLVPMAALKSRLIRKFTWRGKLRAFLGTWSSSRDKCSDNLYLLEDSMTIHRIPMVDQTDCVKSKIGIVSGKHSWLFRIKGPLGTHFSIGLATAEALVWRDGYASIVGGNEFSWGWDLVWGNIIHNGRPLAEYPPTGSYQYTSGDQIVMKVDMDRGEIRFALNGVDHGTGIKDLPKVSLYPAVGMVYGNQEVTLVYLGRGDEKK